MQVTEDIKQVYTSTIQNGFEAIVTEDNANRGTYERKNCYASQYSSCPRQLVYQMTKWHELPPYSSEVLAKMRRGSDRERDLLIDLARAGRSSNPSFLVVGQQERFVLHDRDERVVITGKVDARLLFANDSVSRPLEIKNWSPFLTDRITRFEDLFSNYWTRKGAMQLLCYCYGAGSEIGFMLLDRQGLPLVLPVELTSDNLFRVELFLQYATEAMDHKAAGTLPDYCTDAQECSHCPYRGSHCDPPVMAGKGAQVLQDPEIAQWIEKLKQLEEGAKEYSNLDNKVKQALRGVELGICGNYLIEGKWSAMKKTNIPDDVKAKYTTIDPHGQFRLKITPIG